MDDFLLCLEQLSHSLKKLITDAYTRIVPVSSTTRQIARSRWAKSSVILLYQSPAMENWTRIVIVSVKQ